MISLKVVGVLGKVVFGVNNNNNDNNAVHNEGDESSVQQQSSDTDSNADSNFMADETS